MPRANNREVIIAAALRCFARQGYDGTRIADIAAESGLSVAALYVHFPSVKALAQELYLRHLPPYARALQATCEDAKLSVPDRAEALVHLTLATYRDNPDAFRFVLNQLPRFLRETDPDAPLPLDTITGLIGAGQQIGVFRDGDPRVLAAMFLGAILRVITLDEFGSMHGFRLEPAHESTIIAAATRLLGVDQDAG